nr:unnamed protein product [Callosobruchus analis]
MRTNLRIK